MKAKRTVLDAELLSMADRMAPDAPDRAELLSEAVVRRGLVATDAAPAPPEGITIKLVCRAGESEAGAAWVREAGGDVVSTAGEVLVANVPSAQLGALESMSWIRRAEAPRYLMPKLDEARAVSGLDAALNEHTLTGNGVLLGVVDTGVDWGHQDFQNDDDTTRFELFVHAFVPPGQEVSQIDEFDAAAINATLQGNGNAPQGDPNGHGTHCASIAAGNGRSINGNPFRGVAPGAALVGVRSEPLLDTHTIFGIRRTFELAGNRPAVVSLSLGGHLGAHDGTTALENAIARESGPGRIVVIAAGNEGGDGIHFAGEMEEGVDLEIPVRNSDPNLQFIDVWIERGDEVDVVIESPDGVQHPADGTVQETDFGFFRADFREDSINRDQNLTLAMAGGQANDIWTIRIQPQVVRHGMVHAWGATRDASTSRQFFPGSTDPSFSIGMPATEERAISVGSLVSRTSFQTVNGTVNTTLSNGQLSSFSSHGPTRYGALKPDLAAPGQFVTAALSANSDLDNNVAQRHHPNGPYVTIQGTSMATPFVAGVVALLLEREPNLTPEEVQQRLRITCRRDGNTGRVWGGGFGFGKLDVEALLNYQG